MEPTDVSVEVRNSSLTMVGRIRPELLDIQANLVHCGVGQWTIKLPQEYALATALQTKGAGIVVRVKLKAGWTTMFSGPTITPSYTRTPEDSQGLITIQGVDDNVLLQDALAWGDPGHALNAQATAEDIRSGPAETLMKEYVNYNIGPGALLARRGAMAQKVTIATDTGAGATVKKSPRFKNLLELLSNIALNANMGFRIVQVGANLQFQTYTITDRTPFIRFSVANGNLAEETTAIQAPSITRTIVAGKGKGTNRVLIQRTTADSLLAEDDWGRKIEQWVDQRDQADTTELNQAGDEPLIAGGFTAVSAKAVPNESINVKYGDDWKLGDKVKVVINNSEATSLILQTSLVANSAGVDIGCALGDISNFKASSSLQSQLSNVVAKVSALEKMDSPDSTATAAVAAVIRIDNSKVETDLPSSYLNGTTLSGISTGWFNNFATIVTHRTNDARCVQTLTVKNTGSTYTRSSNDASTWGPWKVIVEDSGWVTSGFTVGAGAASIGTQRIRRVGNIVSFTLNSIVISTGINTDVYGNLTNTVVAKVPAGFEPAEEQVLGAYGSGGLAAFLIQPSGNIFLTAVAPNSTWTANTTWTGTVSCGGVYLLG